MTPALRRLHPLRMLRQAAPAGAACRRSSPACRLPAGTGLTRRSFLLRSAGLALPSTAARAGAAGASRRASRPRSRRRRAPCSSRSSWTAALDALSLLAPVGDPRYAALRPTLALPPSGDARRLQRGHAAALAPVRRAAARPARARARSPSPGDRLRGANQSHFTSRHFWEVGEINPSAASAGSGATSTARRPDNPLQGLSLDYTCRRRSRRPRAGRRRRVARATASGARDVWGDRSRRACTTRSARSGSAARPTTRELAGARRAARADARCASSSRRFRHRRAAAAVTYPSEHGFARRLAALAEMLGAGPAAALRRARRQRRLRHALRPGRRCRTTSR